jgi:Co/Zn/Cd efflux system component
MPRHHESQQISGAGFLASQAKTSMPETISRLQHPGQIDEHDLVLVALVGVYAEEPGASCLDARSGDGNLVPH